MNVICVYKLPIPTYVILRNSTTSTDAVNGTINYQLFLRTQANIGKWLKVKGCPWCARTFRAAAEHGNLDNMKWLQQNGCPWDEDVFRAAVMRRNLDNINWLRENGCPIRNP